MKTETPIYWRLFRYFREGFSHYLILPVSVFNYLTIAFYLLVENIPSLKNLFPNFIQFAILSVIVFVPISTIIGWLHIRRTKAFSTDLVLSSLHNPVAVYTQYVLFKALLAITPNPSEELKKMCKFWEELDRQIGWRPE